MLRDGSARTSYAQGSVHQSTGNRCLGADPKEKFNTPGINAVNAGIRHFLIWLGIKSTDSLAWRSRPPGGERISVVTPLRRRYETMYASPFNHVGMRGNPFFPQLHTEP